MAILHTSIAVFLAHLILLLGLPVSLVDAVPVSPVLRPVTHLLQASSGKSAASDYWVANIKRQGTVPFGNNPNYQVYRNVQDFGAKGMCYKSG